MNKRKLKAVMVEYGDLGKDLARALGISQTTFSAKLNSKNGTDFNHKELTVIVNRYKLSPSKISEIFFDEQVSC